MHTADKPSTNGAGKPEDRKRKDLRDKIAAGESRQAERSLGDYARDARENATGFVREHPIAMVGAALAIGVVLAAIIPGPGRRLSQRVGKTVGSRTSSLATMAAELGIAYAASMMNAAGSAAQTGHDKLEGLSDSIGDSARAVRSETARRVAAASDSASSLKRNTAKKAGRALRDLRGRIS